MKEGKDGSGGPRRPPSAAIADPRFAKVHTDPRFMRMPKNKSKVAIDSRFSHMFSDKNFSDPLGVDKRGKAKKKKEKHMLERYYKVGEDNEGEPGNDDETKLEAKLNVKGKKAGEKVSIRETSPKESQKVEAKKQQKKKPIVTAQKVDAKKQQKKQPIVTAQKVDAKKQQKKQPIVTAQKVEAKKQKKKKSIVTAQIDSTSDEDDDDGEGDIDLNSDDSEEEIIERQTGAKAKKYVLQHESESDEEEDGGILNSGSESDDDDDDDDDVASTSSSSSSSSESEAESDVEEAAEAEKVPTTTDGTRRFAMMNMDWEHIKAVDLFMLMRSFLPKGGRVDSVTVYPSEFGIEQMKTEEVHGPKSIYDNDDEEEEENKEIDMEKLRAYEKNKLKYYYAVVECDSKSTADHLYKECDGMEFERTSNTLDLRFIPDDMKFTRDPRDVAKDAPDEYKAPLFETRALQHSNVKLTWDDDEPTRVKALRRKFNSDQLNEMDFKTYLGSESSEEEDVEDGEGSEEEGNAAGDLTSGGAKAKNARDKYRSLLLGDSTEEATDGRKKGKGDVDMEVTFHTGLSELSDKLLKKQEEKKRGDEGVWEAYLRKKKEKKAQKKRNKNAKNSDDNYSEDEIESPRAGQEEADPFFTHDDNGFDDPFFADDGEAPKELKKVSKSAKSQHPDDEERAKKREEKEQKKKEEERSKAELELLLMDDEGVQGAARGFNLKSKKDKKKKEKGKKKKGKSEEGDAEEDDKLATANLDDPRFASLFTSHHYAIDPTNPQFRKSAAQLKILAESQKRRSQKSQDVGDARPEIVKSDDGDTSAAADASGTPDRKRKAELSSMVRSLKRKVGGRPGTNNKGKKS